MWFVLSNVSITQCSRYLRKRYFIIIKSFLLGLLVFVNIRFIIKKLANNENLCSDIKKNLTKYNSLYALNYNDIVQIARLYFPVYKVVHINGNAYDIYSIGEFEQQRPGSQWLTFPLPGEVNNVKSWMPELQSTKTFPYIQSPKTTTGLAYLDNIYVVSDPALTDRIKNMKYMFNRHEIPISSIRWRFAKYNRSICTDEIDGGDHHRILNLSPIRIRNSRLKRYCAVTIQHVEIWHEILMSSSKLSLILEDDAIFVPFFKEKFNRFVYTAIRTGALKIGETQCATPRQNISANEWINQDPAFVIGGCAHFRDSSFARRNYNATPLLSAHKEKFSRCSHAYVLTRCSAQALLRQIYLKKNQFHIIDWFQTYLGNQSPTLQPFWLDPAIVYQGSEAKDLSGIPTFGRSMTREI